MDMYREETAGGPFHRDCAVCGENNLFGWDLTFHATGDDVATKLELTRLHLGYRDRVHGGILATLLDAAMTHCLYARSIRAVTGDMNIRYHHPVPIHVPLTLRARVDRAGPPLYYLVAEIVRSERVLVSAKARFVES
jgi:acyl-coenzyme A thioesterase PaaI-like protein